MQNQEMYEILNTFWEGIEYGKGKSCAVVTLVSLARYYGMEQDWLEDVATPFGGGVCHSHACICGTLSGALIFLGLKLGRETSAQVGAELLDYIRSGYGSTHCDEILHIDFSDAEQVQREKAPKYVSVCQPVMCDVCDWITARIER